MPTEIISNGSKWAGQEPDTIADLLQVLAEEPLDRSFEAFGNFVNKNPMYLDGSRPKHTSFFGNFLTVSHVFNITTDDPRTIETLTKAIRANQKRKDYLCQAKPQRWRAKHLTVNGRTFSARAFVSDNCCNEFLERAPAWGVIGEDQDGVHVARIKDKGRRRKAG